MSGRSFGLIQAMTWAASGDANRHWWVARWVPWFQELLIATRSLVRLPVKCGFPANTDSHCSLHDEWCVCTGDKLQQTSMLATPLTYRAGEIMNEWMEGRKFFSVPDKWQLTQSQTDHLSTQTSLVAELSWINHRPPSLIAAYQLVRLINVHYLR